MGHLTILYARSLLIAGVAFASLATTSSAMATLHVIQFGGTLGLTYSPSSLSVSVGDTVEWRGDFSSHPLSSTTIPAGAASWHHATGTVFDYVVTVPGSYNYRCDIHWSLGMVGSFVATATGVEADPTGTGPTSFILYQNYPNPFNPSTLIDYQLPAKVLVTLKVFDALGNEVETLVNGRQDAGNHSVQFNASNLPSGVYFYQIEAGKYREIRKLLLLK